MSTRKGTVVFLDQIIRYAASVMHDQMRKDEVKCQAIDLTHTAAYLQYDHVSLSSIELKNTELLSQHTPSEQKTEFLIEPPALRL